MCTICPPYWKFYVILIKKALYVKHFLHPSLHPDFVHRILFSETPKPQDIHIMCKKCGYLFLSLFFLFVEILRTAKNKGFFYVYDENFVIHIFHLYSLSP